MDDDSSSDARSASGRSQDGNALFDAILASPSGITFTVDDWDQVWSYVRRPDRRFTIAVPEMLDLLDQLVDAPSSWVTPHFPFVLSAGEHRSFTANTIVRDPSWRRRDAAGALRVNPDDARRLGLADGDQARVVTERGSACAAVEITEMMRPGHISLNNGFGVGHPTGGSAGVAPNDLTSVGHRDTWAGTPWHKHVLARVEPVNAGVTPATRPSMPNGPTAR